MSKQVIDARGLSCPMPVILTSKAISKQEYPIEITVDTVTSKDNLIRLAEKNGLNVRIEEIVNDFKLILEK